MVHDMLWWDEYNTHYRTARVSRDQIWIGPGFATTAATKLNTKMFQDIY